MTIVLTTQAHLAAEPDDSELGGHAKHVVEPWSGAKEFKGQFRQVVEAD